MEQKSRGRPRSTEIAPLGEVAQRFGERVRKLREGLDWNQAKMAREVARELGKREHEFHPTTLAKLERGTRPTPLDEAAAVARVLGVPLDRLLSDPAVDDPAERELHEALVEATARSRAASLALSELEAQQAGLRHRIDEARQEKRAATDAMVAAIKAVRVHQVKGGRGGKSREKS